MNEWLLILLIIVMILILLSIFVIYTKRKLTDTNVKLNTECSKLEHSLKNKFDLIPTVLELAKKYKIDENNTLKGIIESRNKWNVSSAISQKIDANDTLTESLINFFTLAKNYPNMKKDAKLLTVIKNLKEIDQYILNTSISYNENARNFNTKIKKFPTNLIAKIFKINALEVFKVSKTFNV